MDPLADSSPPQTFQAALRRGDLPTLKSLVETAPTLIDSSLSSSNSLLIAASAGQGQVCRWLKRNGASCRYNDNLDNALEQAALSCQRTAVRLLLQLGAKWHWDLWSLNDDGVLNELVVNRKQDVLLLLASYGAPLSGVLSVYAYLDKWEQCQYLLSLGVNGTAALLAAADCTATSSTSVLLEFGVSPDVRDADYRTPLHLCATGHMIADIQLEHFYEGSEIAKSLIAAGADIDAQDKDGMTALHWAAYDEYQRGDKTLNLVQILGEGGADMHIRNNAGQTAYQVAVEFADAATQIYLNHAETGEPTNVF